MRVSLLSAGTLLLRTSLAVFADEAWSIDYHHALLGLPREETTFLHQPNPSSRAALIYTLSEDGVVGAVNPRDGLIVWRQVLRSPSQKRIEPEFLRPTHGQDVVVSGSGQHVAAWGAADGKLIWDFDAAGQLEDVEILELSDGSASPSTKDVISLTSGKHSAVQRIDGATGLSKWTFSIDSGDAPYQLSASPSQVFAILLHKTLMGNLKLKVISLDPTSGRKLDEYTLSSDTELAQKDGILIVGANSASPIIAWTDPAYSVLKVNVIGNKPVASFPIETSGVERIRLHAPYHGNALSHFLVHYETSSAHWADVFHVDLAAGKVSKAYTLPKISGKGTFTTSTLDANVYFTRITREEILTVSSASHGILGRWPLTNFGVIGGPGEIIEPVHAASEVSVKGDTVTALRTAALLSTGDWVLLREGKAVWQRPESLANTLSAAFATPAAVETLAHDLNIEAHSSPLHAYIHRVTRHIQDLQQLPAILIGLPQSFMRGLLGTTADSDVSRDIFGFRQIIACATANGRVIALDASDPTITLWNRQIASVRQGESWDPKVVPQANGVVEIIQDQTGASIYLNATTGGLATPTADSDSALPNSDRINFALRNGEIEAFSSAHPGNSLWHFVPTAGERIVSLVSRPVHDPVASIGKVLGDRRVLYKYLSPNLALLVTADDARSSITVHVLDTASGSTIHSSVHEEVDVEAPITSVMSENWFAYSYTSYAVNEAIKGHRLVVGELFESLVPNDRGPLTGQSNYSTLSSTPEPYILFHTYQTQETISKLSVTQTKQGITSRQLLAVFADSDAIVGIPYFVLDPRRPVGRDPNKDEQAEGLTRYVPVLDLDPKWYITHKRDVVGIREIITSPALIESTSLVFAYGLDVFGTRLSPSFSFDILGKDFNKFQMLATVAALAVATFVVGPLVTRKQVNTRWAFT